MYDKKRKYTYGNAQKLTYEARSRIPSRVIPVKPRLPIYAIVVIMVIVVGGMVGAGFLGAKIAFDRAQIQSETTVILTDPNEYGTPMGVVGQRMSKAEVYSTVSSSIVKISTGSIKTESLGGIQTCSGVGSGVVISSTGDILTNYHVVEGATSITVTLSNGSEYTVQTFKGDALTDIAVLNIGVDTSNVMAVIADTSAVHMADEVVLLGYPLNSDDSIISEGIISGINKPVIVDGIEMNLLQTTASVNPGNSGGGLFNLYGVLVGVVNAKGTGENIENVGYAIPANNCLEVATQLIEQNYVTGRVDTNIVEFNEVIKVSPTRPWVGLYVARDNTGKGSFISSDYIKSVAGQTVLTRESWNKVLNQYIVGDTLDVIYIRDNIEYTGKLTLVQKRYCDS